MGPLAGKVALVAGGTRGAGRGIAMELGAAGATVYVTGRSGEGGQSEYARPETIEETAALVDGLGGEGVPVRVDHLVPEEADVLVAVTDYGGPITAMIARDNMAGTQFHPEKSQKLGLKLIANFLRWRP